MIVINELDIKQVLKVFWDKKIFIVFITIVFAMMGVVKIKCFTTPIYEASGRLICSRSQEAIEEGATVTVTELSTTSSLAETYAELIKSDAIVSQVIQNLGLNMSTSELRRCITLTPVTKVYYQVSVKGTERQKTAEIANEFIKVFSEEVKKIYEIDSIHIVDRAQVPIQATNMNLSKAVAMYSIIGLGISSAIVMIMFIFNNTVTNADQIKRYTKLTTLVSIPKYNGTEDLITVKESKSPYAESIKILRTNLQYMYDKGDLQTVGVTSSLPGEGKSWIVANLGVAFANSGKKTLIIDADMRRGRQDKIFNVKRVPGLSEYLRADKDNERIITIKGKRVKNTAVAKVLSKINKKTKIEKMPMIANLIYKEEDITMSVSGKSKSKALKKETTKAEEVVIVNNVEAEEPVKKTSRRISRKKVVEDIPELDISDFVNKTSIDNLYVLPAGKETIESSELLATEKLENVLAELKEDYDMIIVDTPPVSVVADGFIISRMVDTNMIVLKHGNTEISELNKIKTNIEEIGGEVIGTVINKIPDANKKYYSTYYNKKV